MISTSQSTNSVLYPKIFAHMNKCSETVHSSPNIRVTLGCFAKSEKHHYALTCKHISHEPKSIVFISRTCEVLGQIQAFSSQKDIAAIELEASVQRKCETALRDEYDKPLTIPCSVWLGEAVTIPLDVYIIGAESRPGIGKLVSTEHHYGGFSHFFFIENKTSEDFCQPGDSGAIVIGRLDYKTVRAMGMIYGQILGASPKQYLAVRLKDSLPELERVLGRLELLDH